MKVLFMCVALVLAVVTGCRYSPRRPYDVAMERQMLEQQQGAISTGQVYVWTRDNGSECIIRDGGLMEWAKGVPNADKVHHRRFARIRVENGPYGGGFPSCEAEEVAGSRRGDEHEEYRRQQRPYVTEPYRPMPYYPQHGPYYRERRW